MADSFFITTAIDYTNGAPHIGHAYEKVLADVLARYHRLKGDDVFFLTGVDQHGQKVQQSAEKQGVEPQQFVDEITAKFVALWDKLDVQYTKPGGWAATTDAKHKQCVQNILQRLWDDKGTDGQSRWIYKKSQRGFYSVRQEQFLTDKERGPDGEFGPEWGQVEERDEENYYFRLTPHDNLPIDPKRWLLKLIDDRSAAGNPLVIPDFRVSELRNAVEKLDGDLCITRPKARLSWGIDVPFDRQFVTFVWFDALVNYISFAPDYDPASERPPEKFLCWWRTVVHVIGKDILIPAHGIYWPIMLKALGFTDDEIPTLLVHGWWNIKSKTGESEKMSKTLGNVVDPDELVDKYGAEAVRYYLMSDIFTGKDSDFSEQRLVERYTTDLANGVGNLLNRLLPMIHNYRSGKVQRLSPQFDHLVEMIAKIEPTEVGSRAAVLQQISFVRRNLGDSWISEYVDGFRRYDVRYALTQAWHLVRNQNNFIQETAPWSLKKKAAEEELDAVWYTLAESLRIIAVLLSPVLPEAAHGIFDQLNWKMELSGKEERFRLADAQWGGLPDGHQLGKPTPLFPRIETPVS